MRGRRHIGVRHLTDPSDRIDDHVELTGEVVELVVSQGEARQPRKVRGMLAGDGRHARHSRRDADRPSALGRVLDDRVRFVENGGTLCRGRVPVRIEDRDSAAGRLRDVHRAVGTTKQRVEVRAVVGRERDTEACREIDRSSVDLALPVHPVEQPDGGDPRDRKVGDVVQQYHELVTAETGDDVVGPQLARSRSATI